MTTAPDEYSLRGVLDVERVENILRSFASRLSTQQLLIDRLASSRASMDVVEGVKNGVDRALESIERRFAAIESRMHRHESGHSNRLTTLETAIEQVNRSMDGKPDLVTLEHTMEQWRCEIDEILSLGSKQSNADRGALARLDDGHRQLAKGLSAIQEILACKVDRVEVPLFETAGERVKEADEFRISAAPRLDRIESLLSSIKSTVDGKEDRAAVIERMQAIYVELQKRIESDVIDREIVTPLDELRRRVDILHSGISLLQPQNVSDSLKLLRENANAYENNVHSVVLRLDQLESQLRSRASIRLVDKKADRTYCEQLVHEISLAADQKYSSQDESFDQVQRQIREIKKVQNEVDQKLAVSLRFLDWFSTVQLDKQSRMPGTY